MEAARIQEALNLVRSLAERTPHPSSPQDHLKAWMQDVRSLVAELFRDQRLRPDLSDKIPLPQTGPLITALTHLSRLGSVWSGDKGAAAKEHLARVEEALQAVALTGRPTVSDDQEEGQGPGGLRAEEPCLNPHLVEAASVVLRRWLVAGSADPHLLRAVQHYRRGGDYRTSGPHAEGPINGWLVEALRQTLPTLDEADQEDCHELIAELMIAGAESPRECLRVQFELVSKLGEGGFGVVWRARDLASGTHVAVKRAKARNLVEDLRREAGVLLRASHPGVPAYVASGGSDLDFFLAMGLVEGLTLDDWLARSPNMEQRLSLLTKVAEILAYTGGKLHVFHRDLKTKNIMVRESGDPVLLDFGVAKTHNPEDATVSAQHRGNIRSSPPEYLEHMDSSDAAFEFTSRQEVWSFGVIAYEVIVGVHPFDIPGDPPKTQRRIKTVNPDFEPLADLGEWPSLLPRLLDKNPHGRPSDMDEVVAVLSGNERTDDRRTGEIRIPFATTFNFSNDERWDEESQCLVLTFRADKRPVRCRISKEALKVRFRAQNPGEYTQAVRNNLSEVRDRVREKVQRGTLAPDGWLEVLVADLAPEAVQRLQALPALAVELLVAAVQDEKQPGTIAFVSTADGVDLAAGSHRRELTDRRTIAEHEAALKALEGSGLLERDRQYPKSFLHATNEGFRVADAWSARSSEERLRTTRPVGDSI